MEIIKKILLALLDTALFRSDHNPTQTKRQEAITVLSLGELAMTL
jgi:hypothetical protein